MSNKHFHTGDKATQEQAEAGTSDDVVMTPLRTKEAIEEFASSAGEANTASNVGTGDGQVFKEKSGVDLRFRRLIAGDNVTISTGTDDVTINASGGGAEELNDLSDVTIDTPAEGHVLVRDATNFKNRALVEADISDLGDYLEAGDIADFETTTELNARDIANRDTDNHTSGTTNKVYTATEQAKLAGIEAGAEVNEVDSVAGKTGAVTLDKDDVGLGNVDNTADTAKPVSTAQLTALDLKENISASFRRVVHGGTAGTARPSVAHVEWQGSVEPTNAINTDTWIDTT